MGIIADSGKLHTVQALSQLLINLNPTQQQPALAHSVNKPLAEELLKLKPSRRTMQLEKCFLQVLASLPENPIIKDIDVMFNPVYDLDVMKVLLSAYRQKPFTLIWPGTYENGKLIYSEEDYPDYKTYPISDYDIVCIL